jgi:hypothetical protein
MVMFVLSRFPFFKFSSIINIWFFKLKASPNSRRMLVIPKQLKRIYSVGKGIYRFQGVVVYAPAVFDNIKIMLYILTNSFCPLPGPHGVYGQQQQGAGGPGKERAQLIP